MIWMSDYDIRGEISYRKSRIDRILKDMLPVPQGYASTVIEAMNYSVEAGGKRLRPMLMSECYHLFADEGTDYVPEETLRSYMGAIECIHTYSLVHDDLPAMDNDMLRRGMPTTHAKYGEAIAILAGDGLLNYAMELVSRAVASGSAEDMPRLARAQRLIFDRSGIYGMIGGQCADVEAEDGKGTLDADLLGYIHRNKTAALIIASMLSGAILGGADEDDQGVVALIAMRLGVAFQIRDDILDIEGSEDTLGKPIGSDEKNDKLTYVAVHGMEKARQDVKTMTAEAHDLLEHLPGDKTFLHELFDELVTREN